MIRAWFRRALGLLGKSDQKIIAVFAASNEGYGRAIEHVCAGARGFPVWLIVTREAPPEVAADCDHIIRIARGPGAPFRAAAALWPYWVTLSVVTFTAERGFASLKVAPFLVPPWKLLVMNEHGDFFYAWPAGLILHAARRLCDRATTAAQTAKDFLLGIIWNILRGIFWKIAWTLLDPILDRTSAPWRRGPARLDLVADGGVPRKPGIFVCVTSRHVTRRALDHALAPLGLPCEIVFGSPPASAPWKYLLVADDLPSGDLWPLLSLVDRPDTFAARLQLGHSGFQKDIIPRAAFRQLQPGEASCVLAPFPGIVLLDAAKLARLGGLPAALHQRCRWLLLFWNAAAAGWRSYDVGVNQKRLRMITDRAGAELEFCWRLLRQPRSGGAAPVFDDRRGSISFQPSLERPLRPGRRRILVVSPYLPFPLTHGGAVRIFCLSQRLAEHYELILLTFRERDDFVDYTRLASCFAHVIVVDQDELRRRDDAVPETVAQFRSRAMTAAIRQAAAEFTPDLLQIEYTQLAAYRDALPDVSAVLVEHDVTFSLYEQLAATHPAARSQFGLWYRFESHWLQRYEAVAVMSEEERQKAVRAGASAARVVVVPNGVDTVRFLPPAAEPPEPPELLYVGSFRHLPNMVGFEFLRSEVLPLVWKKFPEARVRVVAGPDHQSHWRRFRDATGPLDRSDPRMTIEGFVEDVAPHYARARIVLVPLRVSAGTNIKVLEALACGRAVVSTPIGSVGLGLDPGEEILVADSAADFAAGVIALLSDAALRQRLEHRARQAAVDRYSWEVSAEMAVRMYESIWNARDAGQINCSQVVRNSPF